MIDCLSNPSWIAPQIDFLLYLQSLRVGSLEMFDKFFLSVTILGEFWLPTLVSAIVYWCIDFRAGLYLFSLEGFNTVLAHLFKMIACVYRPWVLDSRVQPSKLAINFAKGYSFPSGHSAMSCSVFGGVAFLLRNKKLWMSLFIGLVLLVGFSRMWLGVHTPQDVVVGLLIGVVLIFLVNGMINWAEKNKNRYLYLLVIINALVVISAIYVKFFNSYRLDYVDGKLLVDPQKLVYNTYVIMGYALGVVNGSFLCRRFFPFDPKGVSVKRRVIRGIVGSIGLITLLRFVIETAIMNDINLKTAMLMMFLTGIIITLVYPVIFSRIKFCRKTQ